jgi:hypothetical protein
MRRSVHKKGFVIVPVVTVIAGVLVTVTPLMRTFIIFWLLIDVGAILMLLYDYQRWYGKAYQDALARRQARPCQKVIADESDPKAKREKDLTCRRMQGMSLQLQALD